MSRQLELFGENEKYTIIARQIQNFVYKYKWVLFKGRTSQDALKDMAEDCLVCLWERGCLNKYGELYGGFWLAYLGKSVKNYLLDRRRTSLRHKGTDCDGLSADIVDIDRPLSHKTDVTVGDMIPSALALDPAAVMIASNIEAVCLEEIKKLDKTDWPISYRAIYEYLLGGLTPKEIYRAHKSIGLPHITMRVKILRDTLKRACTLHGWTI